MQSCQLKYTLFQGAEGQSLYQFVLGPKGHRCPRLVVCVVFAWTSLCLLFLSFLCHIKVVVIKIWAYLLNPKQPQSEFFNHSLKILFPNREKMARMWAYFGGHIAICHSRHLWKAARTAVRGPIVRRKWAGGGAFKVLHSVLVLIAALRYSENLATQRTSASSKQNHLHALFCSLD